MDLASYLLKPVQRMGKYALLLQQLMKAYPDKEVDVTDIRAAEQMVRFQLRHGNDLLAMDSLRDCDVSILKYVYEIYLKTTDSVRHGFCIMNRPLSEIRVS